MPAYAGIFKSDRLADEKNILEVNAITFYAYIITISIFCRE